MTINRSGPEQQFSTAPAGLPTAILLRRRAAEARLATVTAMIADVAGTASRGAARNRALPHSGPNMRKIADLSATAAEAVGAIAALDEVMAVYLAAGIPIHHTRVHLAEPPDRAASWSCLCGLKSDPHPNEHAAHFAAALHRHEHHRTPRPDRHELFFGAGTVSCSCQGFTQKATSAQRLVRLGHEHHTEVHATW